MTKLLDTKNEQRLAHNLSRLQINCPRDFHFSEICDQNIDQAKEVIASCFPLDCDKEDAAKVYARYCSADRKYHDKFLGLNVELINYKIFYKNQTAVAVGGLYKVESEPKRAYMGWFGVVPEYRGVLPGKDISIASSVTNHFKRLAKSIGCHSLGALAEDSRGNARTQKFYKRAGFTIERKLERLGEADRIYICKLGREH